MSETPYKKIHVVINPASGKDEPVLNVLNDVFHQYEDIEWTISVTKKFGDATAQACEAAEGGADLVAGYGGDGTQHEMRGCWQIYCEPTWPGCILGDRIVC